MEKELFSDRKVIERTGKRLFRKERKVI